jgi:hypothetical protein
MFIGTNNDDNFEENKLKLKALRIWMYMCSFALEQ